MALMEEGEGEKMGIVCRSDVAAFYGYMRREGLFLTRDIRFKELAELIDKQGVEEEPEQA